MFSYKVLEADGVIVLTMIDQVTAEDDPDFVARFYADVRSRGMRRILLDWREYQGWQSEEAPTITFFSWIEGRSLFDRIAVVFHAGIRNEVKKFSEIFRNYGKDVRLFQPEQYEAALDWLKDDKAAGDLSN
jgi:hypothetical protein